MSQSNQRYSQIYERGEGLSTDSARMQVRLLRAFNAAIPDESLFLELGAVVERECGIDVVDSDFGSPYSNWDALFRNGQLRDVFDSLGFAFQRMPDQRFNGRMEVTNRKAFFSYRSSQNFRREAVGYDFDESGVVRRRVDERFEIARDSSIQGLSDVRFAAARDHIMAVDRALLQNPIDGRSAIRSTFDAVENVFRLMFERETRINNRSISNNLIPLVQRSFEGQIPESRACLKSVSSFVSWVEAVHFYRHEAGQPVPNQPSEEKTLLLVGQGFGFLRWIASIGISMSDTH